MVNIPGPVWDQLAYESMLRGEPIENVLLVMIWRGLCLTERGRDGWGIVFRQEGEDDVELVWEPGGRP